MLGIGWFWLPGPDHMFLCIKPSSEWAAPSFIQPKKNKTVRFLTDFRELNKRLVRKLFPIAKIYTVLHALEGFTYATTLG